VILHAYSELFSTAPNIRPYRVEMISFLFAIVAHFLTTAYCTDMGKLILLHNVSISFQFFVYCFSKFLVAFRRRSLSGWLSTSLLFHSGKWNGYEPTSRTELIFADSLGANKWYIHHEGGGWCTTIGNCYVCNLFIPDPYFLIQCLVCRIGL
jgi:hypothetical protein